jgi:glycosyltransferase involved in cell wall biosynthesis
LLGFGDCLDELRALTTELRLDPWVTFTGRADDTMIRAYLSTADVGLSPDPRSPFNTVSTMNKTMEYMAFGLPVVAFDLHETRVSAGAAAVYASTDDAAAFAKAICEVLDGPELRAELGRTARRRVQNVLAWEHQRAGYVAAYDELTGTTRDLDLTRVIDVTSGDEPVGVHGRPVGELDLQAHDTLGSGR